MTIILDSFPEKHALRFVFDKDALLPQQLPPCLHQVLRLDRPNVQKLHVVVSALPRQVVADLDCPRLLRQLTAKNL